MGRRQSLLNTRQAESQYFGLLYMFHKPCESPCYAESRVYGLFSFRLGSPLSNNRVLVTSLPTAPCIALSIRWLLYKATELTKAGYSGAKSACARYCYRSHTFLSTTSFVNITDRQLLYQLTIISRYSYEELMGQ